MGGMADSPYNKQPLLPEIACVLTADIQPQPDNSALVTAEFAISSLSRAERTLAIMVPAGELVVVRYVQQPGDAALPLGEHLDVIGGDLDTLSADSFIYGDDRVPIGLRVLDPERGKQQQLYTQVYDGQRARVARPDMPSAAGAAEPRPSPQLAPLHRRRHLSPLEQLVERRRLVVERASLLGDRGNRRANVAADLIRIADVDYAQGIFDPATARQRVPELYYGFED